MNERLEQAKSLMQQAEASRREDFKQCTRLLQEAASLFREILAETPDCAEALIGLADASLNLEDEEVAVQLLQQAVSVSQDPLLLGEANFLFGLISASPLNLKEKLLHRTKAEICTAAEFYRKALAYNPLHIDAALQLADELWDRGIDYGEAVRVLRRILRLVPDSHRLWGYLGFTYYRAAKYSKAVDAYQRAEAIAPLDSLQLNFFAQGLLLTNQIVIGVEHLLCAAYTQDSELSDLPPMGLRYEPYDNFLREVALLVQNALDDYELRAMLAIALEYHGFGSRNGADALIKLIDEKDPGHFETLAERATIKMNDMLPEHGCADLMPVINPWPPSNPLSEYEPKVSQAMINE